MNLDNKTILVMGAGGLLGAAITPALLTAGANVVAVDCNEDHCLTLRSLYKEQRVLVLKADLCDSKSLQAIFEQTCSKFYRLDGAVNTAYPRNAHYGRDFLEVTFDDFSENLSLHLGGYFNFMQQCVRYALTEKKPFSLVNLSSIYGLIAPRFELYSETSMTMPVEYAAIKSALQHLVKYVTVYTKGSHFRVNCVSPGGILANQDARFIQRYKSHCREKGMLEAKDVVGTILFLLSDASEYICGQTLVVDDGFHL